MAELSRDQIEEIVARVTAAVLAEVSRNEASLAVGELRIPMRNAATLGDEVLWAPWTVAFPAGEIGDQQRRTPQ
jgi:hypothetical protein